MIEISNTTIWITVGFVGQALFSARFLLQWIASERRGESVIPRSFWYFSILGGGTLLSYAIWRQDPVFILGQSLGVFIYARNLYFIHRKPSPQAVATQSDAGRADIGQPDIGQGGASSTSVSSS